MRAKRRWRFGTPRPLPGAVGIEKVRCGRYVSHIEVEKIETAWSAGATQGQVARRIIRRMFFGGVLANISFWFWGLRSR